MHLIRPRSDPAFAGLIDLRCATVGISRPRGLPWSAEFPVVVRPGDASTRRSCRCSGRARADPDHRDGAFQGCSVRRRSRMEGAGLAPPGASPLQPSGKPRRHGISLAKRLDCTSARRGARPPRIASAHPSLRIGMGMRPRGGGRLVARGKTGGAPGQSGPTGCSAIGFCRRSLHACRFQSSFRIRVEICPPTSILLLIIMHLPDKYDSYPDVQ